MRGIDRRSKFEEIIDVRPGLSEADIARFIATVQQPPTEHDFADPGLHLGIEARRWKIPDGLFGELFGLSPLV